MPQESPRIGPGSVPHSVISISAQIARAAHEGQVDKAGEPYIEHPTAVAQQAAIISRGDPAVIAAAWLHDVVEDTDWTIEALLGAGIPAEVAQIVDAVTRQEDEGYLSEFIPRIIAAGRKPVLLKLSDIWHNLHPDRAGSLPQHLRMRYETARRMLREALAEMDEQPTDLYVCLSSGETESLNHGGFDVCCGHPRCPGNLAEGKRPNRVLPPEVAP